MALQLSEYYHRSDKHENVYITINNVTIDDYAHKAMLFVTYWENSDKEKVIATDYFKIDFDKLAEDNLYTQLYNRLKQLPEFKGAEDI